MFVVEPTSSYRSVGLPLNSLVLKRSDQTISTSVRSDLIGQKLNRARLVVERPEEVPASNTLGFDRKLSGAMITKAADKVMGDVGGELLSSLSVTLQSAEAQSTTRSPFVCKVCDRDFASEKYLSMHSSLHKQSQFTEAAHDEVENRSTSSLEEETLSQAAEDSLAKQLWCCKFCSKTFSQNSNYRNHMRTHSGERPYPCDICSIGFKERYHLKKHMLFKHCNDLKETCRICGKKFKDSTAVRAHERIHSEARPYGCIICGKSFKTSECLWHHENRSKTCGKAALARLPEGVVTSLADQMPRSGRRSRRAMTMCADSGEVDVKRRRMTFPSEKKNSRTASDAELFKLQPTQQQLQLSQQQELLLSTLISHGLLQNNNNIVSKEESLNKCFSADKDSISDELLIQAISENVSSSDCYNDLILDKLDGDICEEASIEVWSTSPSETTSSESVISDSDIPSPIDFTQQELRDGSPADKLDCVKCDKHFLTAATLEKHIVAMHGEERPYRCELCDNGFKLKVHLKKHHLYRHSDEYPCECSVCGKKFKDSSAVRLHERIHSICRPFECHCGKTFKTRENLWGHRNRGPCDLKTQDFVANNMRLFRSTEFGPILGVPITSVAILQQLSSLLQAQQMEQLAQAGMASEIDENKLGAGLINTADDGGFFGSLQFAGSSVVSSVASVDSVSSTNSSLNHLRAIRPKSLLPSSTTASSNFFPTAIVAPMYRMSPTDRVNEIAAINQNTSTVNILNTRTSTGFFNAASLKQEPISLQSAAGGSQNMSESLRVVCSAIGQPVCAVVTSNSSDCSTSIDLSRRTDRKFSVTAKVKTDTAVASGPTRDSAGQQNTAAEKCPLVCKYLNYTNGCVATTSLRPMETDQSTEPQIKMEPGSSRRKNSDTVMCFSGDVIDPSLAFMEDAIYLDDINLGASESLSCEDAQLMTWSDPVLPSSLLEDYSEPPSPSLDNQDFYVKLDQSDLLSDMTNLFGGDSQSSQWSSETESIFSNLSPSFSNLSAMLS